jgi:hypothetical protein
MNGQGWIKSKHLKYELILLTEITGQSHPIYQGLSVAWKKARPETGQVQL